MLTLNKDGTATLVLGGKTVTLRTPNLDEYADVMDMVEDARFRLMLLAKEATEARQDAVKDFDEAKFEIARKKEREADEIRAAFIIKTMEVLGNEQVERGQLPRWASSNDMMAKLLTHWDTVPFPGSAQPM